MQPTILRFIWKYSKRDQLIAVVLTLASFPLLYLMLEIPKRIVNEAISDVRESRILLGLELGPFAYLFALSGCLLVLVIVSGLFKMRINTYKGIIGERLVRRLRYSLVDRVLRFPLSRFQRVSQGEIIATVIPETEPLAEFCGDSIALPVFQGGTLLTILVFMFVQNPWLGFASIALIPLQLYIIPRLQRRVNMLKKQRVQKVRVLSERLGETISGVQEIHTQGTRRYTMAEFSFRLGQIYQIRLDIFRTKFMMKFLNNTIGQMTPFLFYALGGYLVIRGELSLGALVAALGAYKDILGPWKALLNQYQKQQDASVKYSQIIEQFQPPGLLPERPLDTVIPLAATALPMRLERVGFVSEQGTRQFSGVAVELAADSTIEVVIENSSQRSAFALMLAGLVPPTNGTIKLGGHDIKELSDRDLRTSVAYVGADPFIFNSAISYNLGYALNHRPPAHAERSPEELEMLTESAAAGNGKDWWDDSFGTMWTDFELMGYENWPESLHEMMLVLRVVGVEDVVARGSMQEKFDAVALENKMNREAFSDDLLRARQETGKRIRERGLDHLVSPFDRATINPWSTIAENILFGIITTDDFSYQGMAESEAFRNGLRHTGLYDHAVKLGLSASSTLLRFYENLPATHELVIGFRLDDDEHVEELRDAVELLSTDQTVGREQAEILMIAAFLSIEPGSFNLIEIPPEVSDLLLQMRESAAEYAQRELTDMWAPFEEGAYNKGLSVFDNMIFGRVNHQVEGAQKTLQSIVEEVARDLELRDFLIVVFFVNSQSGIAGSRLPEAARHRIALARTLLKHPQIVIMHDAMPRHSDAETSVVRQRIKDYLPQSTVINIVAHQTDSDAFDHNYVLDESGFRELTESEVEQIDTDELDKSLLSIIQSTKLFNPLSLPQKELLALDSSRVMAPANQAIFEIGEEPTHVYVLLSGSAQIRRMINGIESPVMDLKVQELTGELEVLADRRRQTSLHTQTECEFLKIKAPTVRRLVGENAELSRGLLLDLASKVVQAA